MTRFLTPLIIALIIGFQSIAQVYDPVKWAFSHKLDGDQHALLEFTASIEPGWHVYATKLEGEGPIPTAFDFFTVEGGELDGGIIEPKAHKEYDPNFDMELSWFETMVTFQQRVKLTADRAKVTGELTFMTCDDTKCLPPEYIEFEFDIEAAVKPAGKPQGSVPEAEPAEPAEEAEQVAESASEPEAAEEIAGDEPQIFDPVKWSFESVKNEDGTVTVRATATIEEGWHVYSKDLPNEDGPVPTEFNILSGTYETVGEVREIGEMHTEYDPNFMMDLNYYEGTMTYEQDLKITGSEPVTGEVYFMVCNAERCLPPTPVEFTYDPTSGSISDAAAAANSGEVDAGIAPLTELKIASIDLDNPKASCEGIESTSHKDSSLLTIFLLGFIGGLLALLTPCVFPMIPLTVSFFTKSSEDKRRGMINAFLYGFSIFAIYVLLSLPFHLIEGVQPEILNTISTNAWVNVGFFVVFVVFAISFFGYFEITLPSNVANRVDSASNLGGLVGIFFMALTLAIVSFSCTGPILGSLLAGSAGEGAIPLTFGMAGFGLALALPFGLFAAFPGWMNSLPKSGGWLNQVKVVLGFIEVALAIKFLSNADLVEHWGILKIEAFLGVWIICGLGLAAYLFGWIRFPHDSPNQKPSKLALAIASLGIAFTIYLGSGFRVDKETEGFVSLELLSGIAPSAGYSWIMPSPCPLNMECFHDYEEGLAYAQQHNMPIMIDFTGYACVNCRKMEEHVWPEDGVFSHIDEDYVLISLYVDDRKPLPEEERFEYINAQGKKKKIKTYGDKWATLQTETFANNSQPYYVLMSPAEELLNSPVGYTPDHEEYQVFLECGLNAFQEQKEMTASVQ